MSERVIATAETAQERKATCIAMGSRPVGDCVECPAAVSCPILQLKQLSKKMVTASPEGATASEDGDSYSGDGSVHRLKNNSVTAPQNESPQPRMHEQELAAKKRAATEQAMRERLYRQSNVPQQRQPGRAVQHRTFLELLMDGVTELVVADGVRQK